MFDQRMRPIPIEILFTIAMVGIMLGLSVIYGLPVNFPSGERAAFVGVHYLYPLIGVGIWGAFALLSQKLQVARDFLIALPCYAIVLLVHFHLKLWVPHINPRLYDGFYWQLDQSMRPLVDACMEARRAMSLVVPMDSNFYMIGFISLFYISFYYHAFVTPDKFRQLFLAALLFQGLGGLAYLAFPALGPFLYEPGLDAASSEAQKSMLEFYRNSVAGGAEWLALKGSTHLTAGLGAMPSLHTGGSFLFFLFACKHGRILVPLYALILTFILVAAVSTRWHYLIDVPVGLALAWFSLRLAEKFAPEQNPDDQSATAEGLKPLPAT